MLNVVQLPLELQPAEIHVGDDGSHHAHNGGKDQHPHHEVRDDKEVFPVGGGGRQLSDGCEGEGRPVEAEEVLASEWGKLGLVSIFREEGGVDPGVIPEADVLRDKEVDAGVPVDEHGDVDYEDPDADQVGEVGVALCAVHKPQELMGLGHPVQADKDSTGPEAWDQVEEVCGQHGKQVHPEVAGVHIASGYLLVALLQHSIVSQITCTGRKVVCVCVCG